MFQWRLDLVNYTRKFDLLSVCAPRKNDKRDWARAVWILWKYLNRYHR